MDDTAREQGRSRISRIQILDAAVRVLVDSGYSGATTLAIQEAAAVSRGRLLHHFPSRDALLIAAVHHLAAERVRHLGSRTDWPTSEHERIAVAVEAMWMTYQQPYFWASMELWMAARSHEHLRAALIPEEHVMGAMVRSATDNFFGPALVAKPGYIAVREMLNTGMRGVAMTYAFEPRNPHQDPHLVEWIAFARRTLLPDAGIPPTAWTGAPASR
ncbi:MULTISPECIES: TetR/AcrR family transcriptional regulator [Nocardia]|uniref:TetR/AcrR family transcriptional regulator n=1 Tax=Nocardia TaxID=1817 RepID=UPI000D6862F3|nr:MULTISPECIES: TetR/AcrR family transcriptional regulator [Nocardia]